MRYRIVIKSLKISALAACLFFICNTALASTFYVRTSGDDANSGRSPATAFKTINKAAQVVFNGDIVYVGAGAYPTPVFVLGVKNNSAAVRFVADVNGSFTGDAGTVLVSGATFRVAGSNGVQVEGFSFYGGSAHPMIWQDSFNGTLKDCVFAGGAKSLLMKDGSLTIENCQFTDFTNDAIQVDGMANLVVRDCTITGSLRRGIDIRKNAYVTLDNSMVTNCTGDGVHVEVTTDLIAIDGISDSYCACTGAMSPLDLKQQAFDILKAMRPSDVGYRALIKKVRRDFKGALNARNWTDPWHIDIPDSSTVFDKTKVAVDELNKIYTDNVDFDIIGDELSVNHPYEATITVLGAAMGNLPVTVQINIGAQTFEPFGPFDSPTQGNVESIPSPLVFQPSETFEKEDSITVSGRSWNRKWWRDGTEDDDYSINHTVTAATLPLNFMMLRNGDPVPQIAAAAGQGDIASYVANYVEGGLIKLAHNQVIVLFELYTTDLDSQYADFQDLVTLITLRAAITPLIDAEMDLVKTARDLLIESDFALAECAITQAICGDGDASKLAIAAGYFQEARDYVAANNPAEASEYFKKAWVEAKASVDNQKLDLTADLATKLQPAPPAGWVTITNPILTVNDATLTSNGSGLWMVTQQGLVARDSDFSNNTAWGLRLFGTSRVEYCTINGNAVGGLWLYQSGLSDLTVDRLTLTDNTQYGVYAEASGLAFDSSNIGDWAISGSQIGVAAVESNVSFANVTMSGGSTAAVQLFQSNVTATNTMFTGSGFGLAVETSNVNLTSCTFSGNSVGLYAYQNSLLSVTNSTFSGNTLWGASVTPSGNSGETNTFSACTSYANAGGMTLINASDGDVLLRNATVIRDNTAAGLHFENCNQAVNDQAGGANWSTTRNLYGISCNQSTLTISNVTVANCTSYGIRCEDSTVSLVGCSFTGEFGVYADVTNDSLSIDTSVFDTGSTPGWGVVRYGGTLAMKNTTIDGFSVGVYLAAAGSEQATLLNSTIANATGYGVYINSGDAVVRNMILTGTSYGMLRLAGTTTHTNNLLYGFSTPFSGISADDTEVQKDPRFVDSANGDFHLSVGSPAINAGLDVGSLVATDMESNARPSYDAFEMGAYEYMDANGSFRVLDWTEKR